MNTDLGTGTKSEPRVGATPDLDAGDQSDLDSDIELDERCAQHSCHTRFSAVRIVG